MSLAETDRRLAARLGALRGHRTVDRVAYALSEVANHSILWHGINLADLVAAVAAGDRSRRDRALRRSAIQGIEQALVNGPLKSAINRQRPGDALEHPHQLRSPLTSSFPSGHATAGACAAELMALDLGHRGRWWLLAVAVGWSRVHVGVHHPSDVAAGWVMGAVAARLATTAWPPPGTASNPGR